MTINQPRIVAGPTIARQESYVNCLPLYKTIPVTGALAYVWNNLDNMWDSVLVATFDEGQVIAIEPDSGSIASLYCYTSGQWTSVSVNSEPVDPNTGKTWDPLAQFYTPLAS